MSWSAVDLDSDFLWKSIDASRFKSNLVSFESPLVRLDFDGDVDLSGAFSRHPYIIG